MARRGGGGGGKNQITITNLINRYSKTEGDSDGKTVREIVASDRMLCGYVVTVATGTAKGAGTDANVFIQLYGDKV